MFFPSPQDEFPLNRGNRWFLACLSLLVLTGFGLARCVAPDPRGYGTHQQFGLPPCTFQWMFGIPCPSCGSTTTFAHFVRGEWLAALRTNPAAFALALTCLLFVPWAWISCLRGRLWKVGDPASAAVYLMVGFSLLAVAQWGVRILL